MVKQILLLENMASKIFKVTSKYDEIIYRWFLENKRNRSELRYGENPNQYAYLIRKSSKISV